MIKNFREIREVLRADRSRLYNILEELKNQGTNEVILKSLASIADNLESINIRISDIKEKIEEVL